MRIGITGATGQIGGRVARLLAQSGSGQLRLVVRDASRAPQLQVTPAPQVAEAEFGDLAACREAFTGVDALLLVSAAEAEDRLAQHETAIRAAAEAGVRHVVYTSFLGAAEDAEFTLARDHGATEQMIRRSGMTWTFLRDSFYADVLVDFAGADGVIRGPAGQGRCAFVAREDVAEVAARILQDPSAFTDTVLELTGPEAIDLATAAELMTQALGRPIRYEEETLAQARASRASYDPPEWMMDAWLSTYTAIGSGALDRVSPDVAAVLGRPPLSVIEVMRSLA